MAPFPEEVDVFSAPHWRMKQLVGLYCDKLSKTNFSNNNDFRALLQSLYATFKEFKMHEQIENECIIGLLQQRSRTVYNVHSDNKLSEMLSLFEKGLKNVKNEYEQLNYAKQLKERLEAFTRDFLPHMKEEEEVFQPMLMEYFTYEELKDIKKKVIAQHCSQKEAAEFRGLSKWNQAEELQKVFKYSVDEKADQETEVTGHTTNITNLPPEVMLTIFSYLNPQELCQCSQVSTEWSQLAKTGSLWKHLYPVRWARGDWYSGPAADLETEPDEEWVKNRKDESRAFQEWDEDADIDESEEAAEDSLAINIAQMEKRLLHGLIHNVLPHVGSSVKTLVLAYSSAASSKMVRQILELCPNLEYLDLTQTDISDSAFESWSSVGCCQNLRHLDLSGCEKITDVAIERISRALGIISTPQNRGILKSCRNRNAKTLWKNRELTLQSNKKYNCLREINNENLMEGGDGEQHWTKPDGSENFSSAYVWMLDADDLADIEDAAEWRHRNVEGFCLMEPTSHINCSGSCYSRDIYGLRTRGWQQHCASTDLIYCGHSFCCAGTALRTIRALPESSALCKKPTWTKQSEKRDSAYSGSEKTDEETARVLQFLSLSGCYQITDRALRALTLGGGLPHLEHLNLSGCLTVTGAGLQDLVSACPSLNDEHFYYCDNINVTFRDGSELGKRLDKVIKYVYDASFLSVYRTGIRSIMLGPVSIHSMKWDLWCDLYSMCEFKTGIVFGEGDMFWDHVGKPFRLAEQKLDPTAWNVLTLKPPVDARICSVVFGPAAALASDPLPPDPFSRLHLAEQASFHALYLPFASCVNHPRSESRYTSLTLPTTSKS